MSSRPKILVVGQHFWPEAFRINDICDFLVKKGCDIEVLCGLPNYPSGKFPKGYGFFKNRRQVHNGIRIHRALEIPRGNNSNLRVFLNYISFPISSLFHVPRMLFGKYDKIFIYQLSPVMMSIAGIIVGKIKKVEITMYVLDLWPENLYSVLNIQNPILRKVAEKTSHWHYRKADKLVVLSEKMRSRLIDITGINPENVIVIPQAAEKLYEKEVHDKQLEKRFSKGFNLVFTGSITPAQSFATMIDAAQLLKSDGIDDINWIIVGDGMARKKVEESVNKAGLDNIFYFEGQKPVTDVPKYTALADGLVGCLVESNLLEATIPAKVMSYIAASKPLVLAMDGEVQELVNNEIKGGYVSKTGNARMLADNIKKLHRSPESERLAMSNRLRDYHLKNFERSILLDRLYKFMLKDNSAL